MPRAWGATLLLLLLWGAVVLAEEGEDVRYEIGDYVTVLSTDQGPMVSFFYANGSAICTEEEMECSVYSFRLTGVYEAVDGEQVEGTGVGLADLEWTVSFQQLLNDPLCDCTTMVFNATNDGTGVGGAWDSLTLTTHIPETTGTTHALVELVVDNFQWQTPGHLSTASLVLDTTLVSNDASGASSNAEIRTDQSTTAMVDSGYVTLSPTAEAVAEGSRVVVGAYMNVTTSDVQLVFQAFPDGYELRSELRLGIDSVSDPAILPYDLDSYVSSSAEDDSDAPEGSLTWLNWIIGITLAALVLFIVVTVVTGVLWLHQPSRRFLQRAMNRHTVEEEGGLVT